MSAPVKTEKEFFWYKNENMIIAGVLATAGLIFLTGLFVYMLLVLPNHPAVLITQGALLAVTATLVIFLLIPRIPYVKVGGGKIRVRWILLGGWKDIFLEEIYSIRKKGEALYLQSKKERGKGLEIRLDFLSSRDQEELLQLLYRYTSATIK